jgi:DNA polymerase III subunit epsilon
MDVTLLDHRTSVRYGDSLLRPHRSEALVISSPVQTTLAEAVPLRDVPFVVVDLETTGGSPTDSRITEVGAVLVTGGERIGTFQALVNPEEPIPPFISHLTGIDDFLVREEPPIEAVLPAFLEFARGAVFVAHNARFDFSFLNENLARLDYPMLEGPAVCTAKLARRVVWPEVPNVRLHTLAQYFRTRVKPTHRALDDAMACAEVLDGLLDLGGRLGILTLGDLREAVRARGRPHFGKIRLADPLPHAAGVYRFVGRDDRILYVGKARDLRARVKSYFYGDGRKKIENLLGEVRRVEGDVTPGGELEALVLEARLIRRHEPKYNRRGKTWRRFAYLKLDPSEAYPRLKVVHRAGNDDGCAYLGPFSGGGTARLAKEAMEDVVPLRSCTRAMGARTRFAPCALADIGRCPAPCDGRIDRERYGELVRDLLSSLESPDGLLGALEAKMWRLADAERFEEAASVRDRLRALAAALHRARRDAWLQSAGRLELVVEGDRRLAFNGGALARAGSPPGESDPIPFPCPRERADELSAVHSWLAKNPVRVLACDVPLVEPVDGGARIARILHWAKDPERPRASGR